MILFVVDPITFDSSWRRIWPLWWHEIHTRCKVICYHTTDEKDMAMCVSDQQFAPQIKHMIETLGGGMLLSVETANQLGNQWFPAVEEDGDGSTPWTGFDVLERTRELGFTS